MKHKQVEVISQPRHRPPATDCLPRLRCGRRRFYPLRTLSVWALFNEVTLQALLPNCNHDNEASCQPQSDRRGLNRIHHSSLMLVGIVTSTPRNMVVPSLGTWIACPRCPHSPSVTCPASQGNSHLIKTREGDRRPRDISSFSCCIPVMRILSIHLRPLQSTCIN